MSTVELFVEAYTYMIKLKHDFCYLYDERELLSSFQIWDHFEAKKERRVKEGEGKLTSFLSLLIFPLPTKNSANWRQSW